MVSVNEDSATTSPTDADNHPVGSLDEPMSIESTEGITSLVAEPTKVMRIGTMVKQLLDEVKSAPLDLAARARMRDIYERSMAELKDGLAPELVSELDRLSLPFSDCDVPSESELRIAEAQLVGWLEGLFHGVQTAIFAQQMTARAAFEEMQGEDHASGPFPRSLDAGEERTGPYL